MLSQRDKVLKITTTETFRIEHPEKVPDAVNITANREVLEKMLPQFKGRELESFTCPLVHLSPCKFGEVLPSEQ